MSWDTPAKYLELEKGLHNVACALGTGSSLLTEVCALWFTRLVSVPSLLEFNAHSSLPPLYGCLTSACDCLLKIATNCSSLPFKSLLGRLECWTERPQLVGPSPSVAERKLLKPSFCFFWLRRIFYFLLLFIYCVCVHVCAHKGHTLFVCEGQRTACWEPALS